MIAAIFINPMTTNSPGVVTNIILSIAGSAERTVSQPNGTPLLLAIIGHFVGDFILQNDWMALKKKLDPGRCLVHVSLWTFSVMCFSGWISAPGFWHQFLLCSVLGWSHFIQDHTQIIPWWMEFVGQHEFRTGPCAPWSIIVVDNIWHIVTIWAVWRFIA